VAEGFQAAAKESTQPENPEPKPRKRRKAGGGGDQYQARNIVADYLGLCHDPVKDLPRWLREDKRNTGRPLDLFGLTTKGEGKAHAAKTTTTVVAQADRLRGQPLQKVRGGLDSDGQGRGRTDNLPARPRAGFGGHDQLRPLRGEGRGVGGGNAADGTNERALSFRGLSAALRAFYGAKIEAVCRTLSARDRDAAVRSLLDDRAAALRVLADMRAASSAALKERRQIIRHSRREATQQQQKGMQESNVNNGPNMS
jgi:hypothetical protein